MPPFVVDVLRGVAIGYVQRFLQQRIPAPPPLVQRPPVYWPTPPVELNRLIRRR
jgi:hypothetical protein